jgi:hypothetical protein
LLKPENAFGNWANIRADVLLLGESNNPTYLKTALCRLKDLLPDAHRYDFAGLNHGASGSAN